MNLQTVFKWIGIVDAGLLAAATAIGQADPELQKAMAIVAMVGGAVSSLVATFSHLVSAPKPEAAAK